MELFFPSLLAIVLGAIVFFYILPNMSLYVLGIMSVALFTLGVYQHWKTFPYEYSSSEIQSILKDYAPFIAILMVIIILIPMALQVAGGGSISSMIPAMPSMPSVASVPLASTLGLGTPANNRSKSLLNLGGNGRRNSFASNSFKIT